MNGSGLNIFFSRTIVIVGPGRRVRDTKSKPRTNLPSRTLSSTYSVANTKICRSLCWNTRYTTYHRISVVWKVVWKYCALDGDFEGEIVLIFSFLLKLLFVYFLCTDNILKELKCKMMCSFSWVLQMKTFVHCLSRDEMYKCLSACRLDRNPFFITSCCFASQATQDDAIVLIYVFQSLTWQSMRSSEFQLSYVDKSFRKFRTLHYKLIWTLLIWNNVLILL